MDIGPFLFTKIQEDSLVKTNKNVVHFCFSSRSFHFGSFFFIFRFHVAAKYSIRIVNPMMPSFNWNCFCSFYSLYVIDNQHIGCAHMRIKLTQISNAAVYIFWVIGITHVWISMINILNEFSNIVMKFNINWSTYNRHVTNEIIWWENIFSSERQNGQ